MTIGSGRLAVSNLSRTLNGSRLMPTLSFELEPGHVAFFRGSSGCGKSTALRLIGALDPPDPVPTSQHKPPISLDGLSPADVTAPVWRTRVMLVAQTRVTLDGTPIDLFQRALGLDVRIRGLAPSKPSEAFIDAAVALGLSEETLEREWRVLSGGENQRAALALSFALQPACLLLDEVTSALGMSSTKQVEKATARLALAGTSVIMVTHDDDQPDRLRALLPADHTQVIHFEIPNDNVVLN